jgi:hypothetical protein
MAANYQSVGSVLLGYARVSKGDEQNNLLQARALRAAGCRRSAADRRVRKPST